MIVTLLRVRSAHVRPHPRLELSLNLTACAEFSHALSVSHKPIMRLMMLNTTPTAQLFEAYSVRGCVWCP